MAGEIIEHRRPGVRDGRTAGSRALLLGAALMVAASATGCTSLSNSLDYNDGINEWLIGYRNRVYSAKAWHREKHRHARHPHLHDFCAGFRQGYEDVADGGNGCTPAFPPREYWSWKYQSPVGQSQVGAWFSGYPLGAKAAEQDGVGHWGQIQTSHTIQKEYHDHGLLDYAEPVPMDPEEGPSGMEILPPPGGSVIEGSAVPQPPSADSASLRMTAPTGTVRMPPPIELNGQGRK